MEAVAILPRSTTEDGLELEPLLRETLSSRAGTATMPNSRRATLTASKWAHFPVFKFPWQTQDAVLPPKLTLWEPADQSDVSPSKWTSFASVITVLPFRHCCIQLRIFIAMNQIVTTWQVIETVVIVSRIWFPPSIAVGMSGVLAVVVPAGFPSQCGRGGRWRRNHLDLTL